METSHSDFLLLVAAYAFTCTGCDGKVSKGETYVLARGQKMCVKCGLPERRLRPLKETIQLTK